MRAPSHRAAGEAARWGRAGKGACAGVKILRACGGKAHQGCGAPGLGLCDCGGRARGDWICGMRGSRGARELDWWLICPVGRDMAGRFLYSRSRSRRRERAVQSRRIFFQLISALQYRYRVYSVFDTELRFSPCYIGCLDAI